MGDPAKQEIVIAKRRSGRGDALTPTLSRREREPATRAGEGHATATPRSGFAPLHCARDRIVHERACRLVARYTSGREGSGVIRRKVLSFSMNSWRKAAATWRIASAVRMKAPATCIVMMMSPTASLLPTRIGSFSP